MRTYVRLGLLLTAVVALAVLVGGRTPAYAWSYPAALNTNAAIDLGGDWHPQVTTDGAGHWVAVWDSNDSLGGTIGTDYDILVARSTNNGATWTAPAALNTNAATDSGGDYNPQVTTDGAGHWLAVWDSNENLGGTIGTDWDILVARSTDNGATWSNPAALNTNAATDSGYDWYPQVTTDGAGHWVAVWASSESLGGTIGTDYDILVARSTNNGATWTAPAALNTNAATDSWDDWEPQVTTDGAGNWVAVWQSNDSLGGTIGMDYDILYATESGADTDGDGFDDSVEAHVGTDPLDNCPDDPSDDAWPLDINKDGGITVVADVLNFRGRIGATPGAPNWWQRLDFNADGQISVVGDVLMFRGRIGETCT
jgi:hypothetical protein